MKKAIIIIVFIQLLFFAGCGVSKSEYEAIVKERDSLRTDLELLKQNYNRLEKKYDELKYGADRLLSNSKKYLEDKKYQNAITNLEMLIKKHPISQQSDEAKILLKKTKETVKRIQKEKKLTDKRRLEIATRKMKKSYDKIEKITWYHSKATRKFLNRNEFYVYLGKRSTGKPWMVMEIQYTAKDWLFIQKYTISVNGKNFIITPKYGEIKRDHGSGEIWEWYQDINPNLNMIKLIAKSKETIIRSHGKDYTKDRILTYREKKAIREILEAYEALGGK